MAIGQRIVEERDRLGMSRAELARRSGVDEAQLWRIETGKAKPRMETVEKIAEGLGCLPATLLVREDPASPLTPEQKRWLGLLELLPRARIPDAYAQVARLAAEDAEFGDDGPHPNAMMHALVGVSEAADV